MRSYFITGTDTDVGKTVVAAIMVNALQGCYWKPIQSGLADGISDAERVTQLAGTHLQHCYPSTYYLQASLAPYHAAALENITIDLVHCTLPSAPSPLIVEGAGGVLVPLNSNSTMLTLMQKLHLPVIIVTRGTLGTLNHTLLTIDVLQKNNVPIQGLIFSGPLDIRNQVTLEAYSGLQTLLHVPYLPHLNANVLQTWLIDQRTKFLEKLYDTDSTR